MKASDFVAAYLQKRGVSHVFELVGGMITHLLNSIRKVEDIQIVSCHHEQSAGFAAEGHARISGIPGIALATSGPGATNLITAIGSCYFDSVPTVFITGQVNTYELKGSRPIRQLGFQETDIISIVNPICKSAVQVKEASNLPTILEEAFNLALQGRQGPCVVDLPMNIQSEMIDDELAMAAIERCTRVNAKSKATFTTLETIKPEARQKVEDELNSLTSMINDAQKPLLLLGGGCATPRSRESAIKVAEILKIPVVLSLMGIDALPSNHPYRVGFIGSYGNRWANKALGASDLLVVLGSRLDIRQTGSDVESFCEGKIIWQVDIDNHQMGVRVNPDNRICCSIADVAEVLSMVKSPEKDKHIDWIKEISLLKRQFPCTNEYKTKVSEINPIYALQKLSRSAPSPCIYVTDVGQHQMWAAQSLCLDNGDRFITSGGMGAMGFGIPAAIGAALTNRSKMTLLISGDGSLQVNIQELETIKRNNLNIKIILFNNFCHGMVRQFQESYFHGNLQSTVDGYSTPDFVAVVKAYGIPACRVKDPSSLEKSIEQTLNIAGPSFIELPLSISSKVFPKLAFGRRFGEMEPDSQPIEMEST